MHAEEPAELSRRGGCPASGRQPQSDDHARGRTQPGAKLAIRIRFVGHGNHVNGCLRRDGEDPAGAS